MTAAGAAGDSPTSVAVVGDQVLVAVDSTDGDFSAPSGRIDVYDVTTRALVRSIDMEGQPDSIAITPDGTTPSSRSRTSVTRTATPPGKEEGDLPQAPAGFVQVVDTTGDPPPGTRHASTSPPPSSPG